MEGELSFIYGYAETFSHYFYGRVIRELQVVNTSHHGGQILVTFGGSALNCFPYDGKGRL